jgi:diacylglycerol kinase family enzyme
MTIPAFVNAKAGSAEKAKRALEGDARFQMKVMDPAEIPNAVRCEVERGTPRVLVSGGDGTLASASASLVDSPAELAILRGGTLNHFAKFVGVPEDMHEALDLAATGTARPFDVGCANDRLFLNTSSVGMYVTFVRTRERFERHLPYRIASLLAALRVLGRMPIFVTEVEHEGEKHIYRAPMLFIGIGERELRIPMLGERVPGGRHALHLLVAKGRSRTRLMALALAALARGVQEVSRTPDLDSELLDSLVVNVRSRRVHVGLDGEIVQFDTPLKYRIARDALNVVAPPA